MRVATLYGECMTTATPSTLDELIKVLRSLPKLKPIERARVARSLALSARAIIGDVGEGAIFEAVHEVSGARKRTHAEVAAELGITATTVNEAVTRYRQRHG